MVHIGKQWEMKSSSIKLGSGYKGLWNKADTVDIPPSLAHQRENEEPLEIFYLWK